LALLAAAGQPNVSGIGDGIIDMMTTALQETGCFEVMDRDAMEEIKRELEAAGRKVETEAVDFLVTGAVTQIDMEKTSTNIGWGFIPVIGSVGRTTQKASVGLDLRLVSVSNGKVLTSKRIDSNTEDSSFGVGGFGLGSVGGSSVGFGGAYSSLKGTSLEKVTRDAIFKATSFLVTEAKKAKGISL
jgi:curli biogenesis system outer membrane secretion channel CsgG